MEQAIARTGDLFRRVAVHRLDQRVLELGPVDVQVQGRPRAREEHLRAVQVQPDLRRQAQHGVRQVAEDDALVSPEAHRGRCLRFHLRSMGNGVETAQDGRDLLQKAFSFFSQSQDGPRSDDESLSDRRFERREMLRER